MTDHSSQFEDPSLKAAIRELKGSHRASAELRAKVVRRLAAEARDAADNKESPTVAGRIEPVAESRMRIWRPLAMAASVLISIGGVVGYQHHRHTQEMRELYVRNDPLLDAMTDVNAIGTEPAPAGHTALAAPLADAPALAAEASKALNRAVPSTAKFATEGWKLDAASLCTVRTFPAARFHFTRNGQGMSVISVPREAWVGSREEGNHYDLAAEGHPISGYIHGESMTCVVGDKSVPPSEVTRLREVLQWGA